MKDWAYGARPFTTTGWTDAASIDERPTIPTGHGIQLWAIWDAADRSAVHLLPPPAHSSRSRPWFVVTPVRVPSTSLPSTVENYRGRSGADAPVR